MRILLVAALLTNSILGSLCMMPMAMAAEIPTQQHDESMEGMMTPMQPMSHADCPDCPHHQEKKAPVQQSSSCAGHCLSHATNANPTNVITVASQLVVALPTAVPIIVSNAQDVPVPSNITASPPPIQTDTVVLTL